MSLGCETRTRIMAASSSTKLSGWDVSAEEAIFRSSFKAKQPAVAQCGASTAADRANTSLWSISVEGIPGTLTSQQLEDIVYRSLVDQFEFVPSPSELVSVILYKSGARISFPWLILAEFFVRGHCYFPFPGLKRVYSLDSEATVLDAIRRMNESTKVVHVYGAAQAQGTDLVQVIEQVMKDVQPALAKPTVVKWKRELPGTRCCYLELGCDLVADLFFYRQCGLENWTRFRRQASLLELEDGEARCEPEDATQDIAEDQVQALVPVSRRSLFVTSQAPNLELGSRFEEAVWKLRPGFKCRFTIADATPPGKVRPVKFATEWEADLVMQAYVEFTTELFNDPPVGIFRHLSHVRAGSRSYSTGEANSRVAITGFPTDLHRLPRTCALLEAIESSVPGAKVKSDCLDKAPGNYVVATVSKDIAEALLSLKRPLKMCGRDMAVQVYSCRDMHPEEPTRHFREEDRHRKDYSCRDGDAEQPTWHRREEDRHRKDYSCRDGDPEQPTWHRRDRKDYSCRDGDAEQPTWHRREDDRHRKDYSCRDGHADQPTWRSRRDERFYEDCRMEVHSDHAEDKGHPRHRPGGGSERCKDRGATAGLALRPEKRHYYHRY